MDNLRRFILVFTAVIFITLCVCGIVLADSYQKTAKTEERELSVSAPTYDPNGTGEDASRALKENILFNHETLPLGEFAIGTNTTAYVAGRRFGIEDKYPILIAEKTGPHFAVGDTCYSYSEDTKVYNPDGKEIVARDNEVSILRKENPEQAYMHCHTDITIPYDELGAITVIRKDGSEIPLLKDGRFVLPGTEILNEPLDCR